MNTARFQTIPATLVLPTAEVQKLTGVLTRHLEHAEAIYAAVIDESGIQLVEAQSQPMPNKMEICTLANSALGAVQEISRRLEDSAKSSFFHQGDRMSFAVAQVTPAASLLTIYGPQARMGIVRAAIQLTLPKLQAVLQTIPLQQQIVLEDTLSDEPFDPEAFFAFVDMPPPPKIP
jgi:hypothetical protein